VNTVESLPTETDPPKDLMIQSSSLWKTRCGGIRTVSGKQDVGNAHKREAGLKKGMLFLCIPALFRRRIVKTILCVLWTGHRHFHTLAFRVQLQEEYVTKSAYN
jgi:hypothetical protein